MVSLRAGCDNDGCDKRKEDGQQAVDAQTYPADVVCRVVAHHPWARARTVRVERMERLEVVDGEARRRVVLREREHHRRSRLALNPQSIYTRYDRIERAFAWRGRLATRCTHQILPWRRLVGMTDPENVPYLMRRGGLNCVTRRMAQQVTLLPPHGLTIAAV